MTNKQLLIILKGIKLYLEGTKDIKKAIHYIELLIKDLK